MAKILVIGEVAGGKLRKATLSAVNFAKQLSQIVGGGFDIAMLGPAAGFTEQVQGLGAEKIYAVKGDDLEHYLAAPYAKAIADLVEKSGADYIAAAGTTMAKDMLPRVAARLGAGMVSNVVKILNQDGGLYFVRPMWADNAFATVKVNTPKAVFTVRATEFDPVQPEGGTSPVEEIAFTADESLKKARFVNFAANVSERPELTEAEIIVSGGRGLISGADSLEEKKKKFFSIVEPLADLLGAAIGGTRLVVDEGVLPNDLQVGQTGKVVAPKLYFAIAISGAIQHIAGMKNSKVIVAINKDEEAPIFSVADYGLVADAFKAVPALIEEIKKIRGA